MANTNLKLGISDINIINILVGFGFITSIFLSNNSDLLSTQITVPYRIFSLVICILVILLNIKSFRVPSINSIFLLVFYLAYILRIIFTVFFHPEVFNIGTDISMYFFSSIGFVFIPCISVLLSIKHINFSKVLYYSFYVTLFTVLISIWKMDSVFLGSIGERINGNVAISTITLGNIGVTLFCLSISVFSKSRYLALLSILGILAGSFVVIISGSRGPIFSLFISIFLALIFRKRQNKFSLLLPFIIIGFFFVFFSSVLAAIAQFSTASEGRILLTLTEGDTGERDQYFSVAVKQFLDHPFFGGSFVLNDGLGKGDYPHNIFLESLLSFGLLGGFIMIFFYYLGFKFSLKSIYYNLPNKWLAFLFIQYFLFSSLSGALWSSIHFIIILAILLNNYSNKVQLK